MVRLFLDASTHKILSCRSMFYHLQPINISLKLLLAINLQLCYISLSGRSVQSDFLLLWLFSYFSFHFSVTLSGNYFKLFNEWDITVCRSSTFVPRFSLRDSIHLICAEKRALIRVASLSFKSFTRHWHYKTYSWVRQNTLVCCAFACHKWNAHELLNEHEMH